MIKKYFHAAYRSKNAAKAAEFYSDVLGMNLALALASENIPSSGMHSPHAHVMMELDDGSYIAFFEVLLEKDVDVTPVEHDWAQHLALEVESRSDVDLILERLRERNVEVMGPVEHGALSTSWYFYDPDGHRVEVAIRGDSPEIRKKNEEVAPAVLEKWSDRRLLPA